VTVIAAAGMVVKALAAAEQLAASGVSAEVIDVRSLRPLDITTMAASLERTGRALVLDEGWRTGGLNAEIAAQLTEVCFWSLDAPIARLAAAEVPVPYARHLELAAIPQVDDIVRSVDALLGRSP
jgi:pyruvate/2-oxoglutarate/acetoin dehydrogenase E1 component